MDDINNTSTHFHLRWRVPMYLLAGLLFSIAIYNAVTHQVVMHIILIVFNLVATVVGIWFISSIEVNENGLVLYKINNLKWHEITSAKKTSFLGLPYILLKRKKGATWWLPLYYVGDVSLQSTLLKVAPEGNPLKDNLID